MGRLAFFLLVILVAAGVPVAAETRPVVVSVSTVVTEIAREVGGNAISVVPLIEPGMDPHQFDPAPEELKRVAGCSLILASGKHLESFLPKVQASAGGSARLVEVGDALPSLTLEEEDHDHGHSHGLVDPHWWQTIPNMKRAVSVVRDALVAIAPTQADAFRANADQYVAKLDALDRWARKTVAQLPRNGRKLVTSHDAFQYFAKEYGFRIYPIEGVATHDEPSARDIAALIETIKTQQVKAVFIGNVENPKIAEMVTRESGAKLGGELYADGLGTGDGATYEGMFRHNVTTIVEGLK